MDGGVVVASVVEVLVSWMMETDPKPRILLERLGDTLERLGWCATHESNEGIRFSFHETSKNSNAYNVTYMFRTYNFAVVHRCLLAS